MNSKIIIGLTVFLGTALLVSVLSWKSPVETGNINNSSTIRQENGVQIIRISARGGYSPRVVAAQAGIPTKLEVETKGTYDCSSSLVIPALGVQELLSRSGTKTIDIPAQEKGSKIVGTCAMGMYSFTLNFN